MLTAERCLLNLDKSAERLENRCRYELIRYETSEAMILPGKGRLMYVRVRGASEDDLR